jgi:hypothetical protein
MHLPVTATAAATAEGTLTLTRLAALRAALGFVGVTTGVEKLLLSNGEGEGGTTFYTN